MRIMILLLGLASARLCFGEAQCQTPPPLSGGSPLPITSSMGEELPNSQFVSYRCKDKYGADAFCVEFVGDPTGKVGLNPSAGRWVFDKFGRILELKPLDILSSKLPKELTQAIYAKYSPTGKKAKKPLGLYRYGGVMPYANQVEEARENFSKNPKNTPIYPPNDGGWTYIYETIAQEDLFRLQELLNNQADLKRIYEFTEGYDKGREAVGKYLRAENKKYEEQVAAVKARGDAAAQEAREYNHSFFWVFHRGYVEEQEKLASKLYAEAEKIDEKNYHGASIGLSYFEDDEVGMMPVSKYSRAMSTAVSISFKDKYKLPGDMGGTTAFAARVAALARRSLGCSNYPVAPETMSPNSLVGTPTPGGERHTLDPEETH